MCKTNTNHPRTRHVCRSSARQQKSTRHKMSRCSPYPPAALPSSLSMASSATDLNCDTAAPYEPDGGVRRPGLLALRLVPFFGLPKWCPSEYCEAGGALAFEWPLLDFMTQQPTERWCRWGGGIGEAMRTGGTRGLVGEDVCPSFRVANGATKKRK